MRRIEASLSQDRKDCHPIFGRAEKIVSWSFSLQDWKLVKDNLQIGHGQSNNYKVELQYIYILQIWCTGPRELVLLGQPLCRYDLYTTSGEAGWFDVVICDAKIVAQIGVVVTLSWYDMIYIYICIFDIIYIYSVSLCLSLICVHHTIIIHTFPHTLKSLYSLINVLPH